MNTESFTAYRMSFRTPPEVRVLPRKFLEAEGWTLLVKPVEEGGFVGAALADDRHTLVQARAGFILLGCALSPITRGSIDISVPEAP